MTRRGVIAAGHTLTADAGADILRQGGNAVDAAIAAVAMACVCEPVLCSPGGGAFMMVRDGADGSIRLLDAFVQTPRQRSSDLADGVHEVYADFGTARQAFHIGPATTATPGLVDGITTLAARFATEPLTALVTAATRAARTGVVVTPFQHHLFTVVTPILTATDGARALYAPDGDVIRTGATFRNPGLADTLELVATDGFGASAVGEAAIDQQRNRGHLTADDLAAYEVVERRPLALEVRGATVHLNPLPAAGGVLVAHTLSQLTSTSRIEVARALGATGAARRTVRGDLAALAALPVRQRGTTQVSVVDTDGTACSITASNGEGNGELVDGFGFMLNNILGEDDVNPHGSAWPTDTRLSSMMCPAIVEGGDGTITALGSGGSSRIRSAISQVVAALCLDGADLATAIDAPRVHVENGHLDLELGDDPQVVDSLRAAFPDHLVWPEPDLFFGGVHAAQLAIDGRLAGKGDPRRSGAAVVVQV